MTFPVGDGEVEKHAENCINGSKGSDGPRVSNLLVINSCWSRAKRGLCFICAFHTVIPVIACLIREGGVLVLVNHLPPFVFI